MSYPLIEVSQDNGRPVELYQIAYTNNVWRYTSAPYTIQYLGDTYVPFPIMRSDIEPSAEINKAQINITLSVATTLADVFRVSPPSELVSVTIFAEHYEDNGFITVWKGHIRNAEWGGNADLILTSDNIFSSLQRVGIRRRCQLQCPFVLYGELCGVDREGWDEETTVTSISGVSLIVPIAIGKINSWYAGGYVTWVHSVRGNVEKRMVRASVGSTGLLTLSSLPVGLPVGHAITLYAGCSHTLDGANGCILKFNNHPRYGGTPFMPTKKPFGSTLY
jgi:hypothetical protein